jgi:ABC-type dipeptide/oligopeptide/nickel transport system permease component
MAGTAPYLVRRVEAALVTILLIVTMNFVLFRAVPGDAADALTCRACTGQVRMQVRHALGLDQSLPAQYLIYLKQLARGDFGTSVSLNAGEPAGKIVGPAIVNSLPLVALAMLVSVVLGVLGGVMAVRFSGSVFDRTAVLGSLTLYAMPSMWIGLVLVIALAGVLPVSGATDPLISLTNPGFWGQLTDRLSHLVVPAVTLAAGLLGQFVLITRSAVMQTLGEDYIMTARAKGLTRGAILWRYGFRNASLPITALIALTLGSVIAGTILVETVFSYPGIGRLTVEAVTARDYPVLEAAFLVLAVAVVFFNLMADFIAPKLDPRVTE